MHQNRRWRPPVAGGRAPRGRGRAGRAGRCLVFPLGAKLPGLFGCGAACGFGVGLVRPRRAPQAASARAGAASQPGPALAPAVPCLVSPALAALRPRTPRGSVETERVPHTLLSPTRMAGLIPRYILSYGLGEQTQSSLWPHSRSCTLTAYLLPCPPVRGRPTCGSPAGTIHFLENYTFPYIKTCTPLGPRG